MSENNSQYRYDILQKRWVIIASERGRRPQDFTIPREELDSSFCLFCPGHEEKTPPEITRAFQPGPLERPPPRNPGISAGVFSPCPGPKGQKAEFNSSRGMVKSCGLLPRSLAMITQRFCNMS